MLEELGVPYEVEDVPFADVKKPAYVAVNPNGRLPAIRDPNNGDLVLWESGAIVEYLTERYDKGRKISFPRGTHEAEHARQWLFFQVSGQGPYFGQAGWFANYHPERLPSAVDRFVGEVIRVSGVLEGWLQKQKDEGKGGADGPWLVGGKFSYVDLAWLPWYKQLKAGLEAWPSKVDEFLLLQDWLERVMKRDSSQKILSTRL